MLEMILPDPYREQYIKWRRRQSEIYDQPPDTEPKPTKIAEWQQDPSGFGWATLYCQECFEGELCDYHQAAKNRFDEYRVGDT